MFVFVNEERLFSIRHHGGMKYMLLDKAGGVYVCKSCLCSHVCVCVDMNIMQGLAFVLSVACLAFIHMFLFQISA